MFTFQATVTDLFIFHVTTIPGALVSHANALSLPSRNVINANVSQGYVSQGYVSQGYVSQG